MEGDNQNIGNDNVENNAGKQDSIGRLVKLLVVCCTLSKVVYMYITRTSLFNC